MLLGALLEVLLNISLVGRLCPGILQNIERFMTGRIAWQHSQRSPNPDQAPLRKSNLVAPFEPHVDHLIAEPVCRMYRVARVREQDKALDALAVADRPVTFH